MNIRFTRLPPHWSYLVSRRDIKNLLADTPADVRIVDFGGTSKPRYQHCVAGYVESRVVDRNWCFRLRFHGISDELLAQTQEDLRAVVLADIRNFLGEHGQPVDSTAPARKRILFLHIADSLGHPFIQDRDSSG